MTAICKTVWNVPISQLPVLMGSFWPEICWTLCPTSPHCTQLAVLMYHNLQTSGARGVMFLPLGTGGNKCPFCLREMCPLNRCLIVFVRFCWSTEVRGHQADASEGGLWKFASGWKNESSELFHWQANGAGGPKVTYLTNPACGVAIHICQGSGMWGMQRKTALQALLNSLSLVGLQAQH